MSVLLEAKNISKKFYHPTQIEILKNIHLRIEGGDSVAIIGRSGEGKSTLLQIFGCLEEACKGDLWIDQQLITSKNRAKILNQKLGFVFQSFHLLEDYTVLENILMPARIARQSAGLNSPMTKRAWQLLAQVGLTTRAHFQVRLLSGGEKQRVAIARAMCNDPAIIMADEPSGNLDRQTGQLVHQLLLDFARQTEKALLIVTHDQELAAACSRCYELRDGQLHAYAQGN